jgi:hypothetical protein
MLPRILSKIHRHLRFQPVPGKVARFVERGGYTLAEMVVGFVVVGGVLGVTLQAVSARTPPAGSVTRGSAGGSLDILGTGPPLQAYGVVLVHADRDSVSFRQLWARGVVCALPQDGLLDLAMPSEPGRRAPGRGRDGVMLAVGSPEDPVGRSEMPVRAVGAGSTRCNGVDLPTGLERRRVTVSGHSDSERTRLSVGGAAYLYEQTTYRRGDSGGIHGVRLEPDGHIPAGAGAQEDRSDSTDQKGDTGSSRVVLVVEAVNHGRAGEPLEPRHATVRVDLSSRDRMR